MFKMYSNVKLGFGHIGDSQMGGVSTPTFFFAPYKLSLLALGMPLCHGYSIWGYLLKCILILYLDKAATMALGH